MSAPDQTAASSPTEAYWDFLGKGKLRFQTCTKCSNAWLPAREECPRCLAAGPHWQDACGRARLISWVVYHHAFNEALRCKIPYTVAVVQLEEGPRLISNIIGDADPETLVMDQALELRIEVEDDGKSVPRFVPVS